MSPPRPLSLRRLLARQRTSDLNRGLNRPTARLWPNVHILLQAWRNVCERTIKHMKVCGHCGYVCYGNISDYRFEVATLLPPLAAPYAYCNAFLIPFIHIDDSHYHICESCAHGHDRGKILCFMSPAYIQSILKAKPLYLQLLSLVDCRIGVENKYNGFHSGFVRSESLLESPLICWNLDTLQCSNIKDIMEEVYDVFGVNLCVNKLFREYLCLLETPDPSLGISILPSDVVHHIVQSQREKGIATHSMTVNPFDPDIHILRDVSYSIPISRKRKCDVFDSGNLYCRSSVLLREPMVTNVEGLSTDDGLTLETSMFPFLFPHQHGHYQGGIGFSDYIKRRIQQLFSPFTLYKPYLLLTYELRQSIQLASMTKTCILDKEFNTIKRLQPDLPDEEVYRRMIKQSISYSVPGSPAWHSKHLKDLLCMVQKWGMPSFFLTLTSDEVSSTRWPEINDLEKVAKSFNKAFTWKDCPAECAVLFHNRVQTFMKKYILCGESGVLGKVNEYVNRYELQGRGSLHSHIVLWSDPENADRVASEICAYIPAEFDSNAGKFVQDHNNPMADLLYKYVTTKQLHYCREGGCTHIDGGNGLKYCKLGFPVDVHMNKEASIHPITGKWQYYRPGPEHRNVVPYHPVLLLLWGAHMNIQRVTNEAWSFYLLKYAMKCEPAGSLNLQPADARAIGLEGLNDMQLKLICTSVMSRSISATEAALTCLQISTIHRSCTVTFVDSSPADKRTSLYRKASVVCLHPVQVYCLRPASLSNITFYEYFLGYEVLSSATPLRNASEIVGWDFQGNAVIRTTRLVRFSDFHLVYHCDQFFYNVLLSHVCFRQETELCLRSDASYTYLHECISRKIVTSLADIENLISIYADNHLYSALYKSDMVQQMRSRIPIAVWEEAWVGPFTCPMPPPRRVPQDHGTIENISISTSMLTTDQLSVFERLKVKDNGVHMVTGSPGTGKSFLISLLKQFWEKRGKTVLLTATTGVAAIRLDPLATTVHQAFKIPIKGALQPLHRSSSVFETLHSADIIVIDECSMLTPKTWNSMSSRLHEVLQGDLRNQDPFFVKLIILVGDMCQLPPVCNHTGETICKTCHLSSHPRYRLFQKYHLTTVLRQASDVDFLSFLNSVRLQNPSQHAIDACLKQCFVSEDAGYAFIDANTTIICTHRNDVAKYNALCLLNFFPSEHIVEVPVETNAPPELETWSACPKFHQLSHVAIGARVLITENIDFAKQAVNGATAEVFDLQYNDNGDLASIIVKLHSNGALAKIERSLTNYRQVKGLQTYRKSTFPLALAYSMTGHKSQGCTLSGKVLLVISAAFAPGLTYVMLSRVTNRINLRIVGNLCPTDFNVF